MGLCYHFGVLNIEKVVRSVLTGFLLRKLCVFACSKSHKQGYVFIVVLSHGKLDLSFFFMAGPKMQTYSTHLRPKSPRKIIIWVLEKHVRLVAITSTSPKAGVAASKLVPKKEKVWS